MVRFNPPLFWRSHRIKPLSLAPGLGVTQIQRKTNAPQKGHVEKDPVAPRCHSTSASPKEVPP